MSNIADAVKMPIIEYATDLARIENKRDKVRRKNKRDWGKTYDEWEQIWFPWRFPTEARLPDEITWTKYEYVPTDEDDYEAEIEQKEERYSKIKAKFA